MLLFLGSTLEETRTKKHDPTEPDFVAVLADESPDAAIITMAHVHPSQRSSRPLRCSPMTSALLVNSTTIMSSGSTGTLSPGRWQFRDSTNQPGGWDG